MKLTGHFLPFNVKNKNGRIYPKELSEKMLVQFKERQELGLIFGQLGQDSFPECEYYTSNLNHPSHIVEEIHYNEENNSIDGTIEILDNYQGKVLKEIFESSGPIYVASRSIGSVDTSGNVQLEQLLSFDIVQEPAFSGVELLEKEPAIYNKSDEQIVVDTLNKKWKSK